MKNHSYTLQKVGKKLGIYVVNMEKHIEFRAMRNGQWLGNWFRNSSSLVICYHREPLKGLTPYTALGILAGLLRGGEKAQVAFVSS